MKKREMSLIELISSHSSQLPETLQKEVLDFIDFLNTKRIIESKENAHFAQFSLSQALKDTESEDFSNYEMVKFKEKWK